MDSSNQTSQTKRVLIVEDQPDVRAMMKIILRINGYDVIEAWDGYEAVKLALDERPDIILMDMAMPVLDGLGATRAIRQNEELAGMPILCVTAYGDFYTERAKDAGCDEVIQKPVNFDDLDDLLRRHIDGRSH